MRKKKRVSLSPPPLPLCLSYQANQVYFSDNEFFKLHHVHSKPAWPLTEQGVNVFTPVASWGAALLLVLGLDNHRVHSIWFLWQHFFLCIICVSEGLLSCFCVLCPVFSTWGECPSSSHGSMPSPAGCSYMPHPGTHTLLLPALRLSSLPLWLYLSPPSVLS